MRARTGPPHDFPLWEAAYWQTQRWIAAGAFEAMVHDLGAVLRPATGEGPDSTAAVLHSRTLRSTPESGTRAGYDGAKRKKGSRYTRPSTPSDTCSPCGHPRPPPGRTGRR